MAEVVEETREQLLERVRRAEHVAGTHLFDKEALTTREAIRSELIEQYFLLLSQQESEKLKRVVNIAVKDPGRITPRGDDYTEPLWDWIVRAVIIVITEGFPDS